ncbi:MAG: hypothetical protein HYS25_01025 [Ignavibacteriales bacterium]|nr:hypothetical protein [Ignavibacteriales bacterium]
MNLIKMKRNSKQKFDRIIGRVRNKKACGIIYSVPPPLTLSEVNKMLEEHEILALDGEDACTYRRLYFWLSTKCGVPSMKAEMLPAALNGRMLTIYNADFISSDYTRVLHDCAKNNVPLLLILRTKEPLEKIRHFDCYNKILTIEQDYSEFLTTKI